MSNPACPAENFCQAGTERRVLTERIFTPNTNSCSKEEDYLTLLDAGDQEVRKNHGTNGHLLHNLP